MSNNVKNNGKYNYGGKVDDYLKGLKDNRKLIDGVSNISCGVVPQMIPGNQKVQEAFGLSVDFKKDDPSVQYPLEDGSRMRSDEQETEK